MSEKFALKWNDYQSNWTRSLSELRKDSDFSDVTLISDDKTKFSAHKVLLSSCSNMFKFILKENNHSSPLLYLGGVSSVNLRYILDYIYHGEISLYQEELDSFLESAQNLEIEGLMGQESKNQDSYLEENIENLKEEYNQYQPTARTKSMVKVDVNAPVTTRRSYPRTTSSNDVGRIDVSSLTPEEVEDKMKSLLQKRDDVWICLVCNHTSTKKDNIKKHVEIHFDGLSYPCNLCNKEFRLKNSLNGHKSTIHKTIS